MAQADGIILIDTEIRTDGFMEGAHDVEKAVKRMASTVKDIGTAARTALNKAVDSFIKLNQEYAAQEKKVDALRKKVSEYGKQKIPTDEYAALDRELNKLGADYDKLVEKQRRFLETGGKENSSAYKRMEYDLDSLDRKQDEVIANMRRLEAEGKAFTFGNQTEKAVADMERLEAAERKLAAMQRSLNTSYTNIKSKVQDYGGTLVKSAREVGILESTLKGLKLAAHAPISIFKAFGSVLKKLPGKFAAASINLVKKAVVGLGSAVKSSLTNLLRFTGKGIASGLKKISSGILGIHKNANKTSMSLGRMLGSSLLFSAAFMGISAMLGGMKEGLQNLAQYSNTTNNSISMLISSLETLKNSFASAFAPILNVVAPVLSGFINMISRAVTYVGMFIAALTGQKTYTKALGVQKNYTASLADTAGSAAEAADGVGDVADNTLQAAEDTEEAAESAEDYLSPLDDINRYTKENTDLSKPSGSPGSGGGLGSPGTGGGGGLGGGSEGPLFEEVPILNSIKGIADKIRSLIESENFEGLGAYIAEGINKGLAKIKEAITWENIGPEITYFVNAFTTTFNSLVDNLDWDLLGRTIGEGINTIVNTLNLLITSIDWKNLGAKLAEGFNGLVDEVDFWNLGTLLGNKMMILPQILLGFVQNLDWILLGNQIAVGLNGMVHAINLSVIAEALGTAFTGIFQTAVEFSRAFDWTQLGTNIYEGINTFISTVDWAVVGQGISDFVKGILDTLITVIQGIDWAEVVEAIKTTLVNIDWIGIAGKILEFLATAIGVIIGALAKIIGDAIAGGAEGAVQYFKDKTEECGGNVVLGILKGIVDAVKGIASWIYEHIFKPFIEGFKNTFGINSPSTVMAEQGHYIIEGLLQGISDFMGRIKDKFNEIKDLIIGKILEIKDGAVRKAVEMKNRFLQIVDDIREKFRSGFDGLADLVRSPINWVIRMLNSLLNKVETAQNWIAESLSFSIDLPGWAQSLTGYSSFGISIAKWSIPDLPYLASGAVIPPNREFMAVLGDQKQGNNIEAPEGLIRRIVREETRGSGLQRIEVPVYLNRREIARATLNEARLMRMQTGRNSFELT